jgi:hypothetical protein
VVGAEAPTVAAEALLAVGFTAVADLTVADPTAVVAAVEAATPDAALVVSADAEDMALEGRPWAGPVAHRAPGTPIVIAVPAIPPQAFIPLHRAATQVRVLNHDLLRTQAHDQATRPSLPTALRLGTGNGIPSEVNTHRPEPHTGLRPAVFERRRLLRSVTLPAHIPLPLLVKPGSAVATAFVTATASAAAIGVADGAGAADGAGDLVGDGGGDSAGVRSGLGRLTGITRGGDTITIRLTFTPIHNRVIA